MTGWSMRPAPTPGRSTTGSMPRSSSAAVGADARAQEDRRRADRAGGEGDPPPAGPVLARPPDCRLRSPTARWPANRTRLTRHMRPDGEVGPLPGRQQVGDRGGQAQAVAPVLRERADAGCLWMVVVGDLGEAEASADLEGRRAGSGSAHPAPAADRDRAAAPVQLVGPVRVVFQPTKEAAAPSPSSRRRCPAPPTRRSRPARRAARSWR